MCLDLPMQVTIEIPEAEGRELSAKLGDLNRAALESLAARGYELRILSLAQVRKLMGYDNRWDAEDLLARHGVWPGMDSQDLAHDLDCLEKFAPKG